MNNKLKIVFCSVFAGLMLWLCIGVTILTINNSQAPSTYSYEITQYHTLNYEFPNYNEATVAEITNWETNYPVLYWDRETTNTSDSTILELLNNGWTLRKEKYTVWDDWTGKTPTNIKTLTLEFSRTITIATNQL